MARALHSSDVVVIGGGPGGSAAATLLADRGLRVTLLERARFPREHVGESLLPASLPILDALGALDAVRAEGFLEKYGATMVWGREPEPWSWYFRETNASQPHAYQVWRARFDEILLENARAHGVDVREGCGVADVHLPEPANGEAPRPDCARLTTDAGAAYGARMVVDASGQSALLARKLRLRRWDPFFRNLAVWAYFEEARRLPPPDENNLLIESYPGGWFWHIPLHTGRSSVGAVLDRESAGPGLRGARPEAFLRAQIAAAPHTARALADARLVGGPHVQRDWSYRARRLVGESWVLVGDAACFVDPLFSSGVHLALGAGVLAAAYVATALADGSTPDLRAAAAAAYSELYSRQYEHFHRLARLFYASNQTVESYFWEARRLTGDEAFSPRHAFVRAVAGQPPQGYERVVLEHGDPLPAFSASVHQVASERARRRAELARLRETGLGALVPRLAADVRLERRAVLGEGEFAWGETIARGDEDTTPCSPLVAGLVRGSDGHRSLAEIARVLARDRDADATRRIAALALDAAEILYVDGVIESLKDGAPPRAGRA